MIIMLKGNKWTNTVCDGDNGCLLMRKKRRLIEQLEYQNTDSFKNIKVSMRSALCLLLDDPFRSLCSGIVESLQSWEIEFLVGKFTKKKKGDNRLIVFRKGRNFFNEKPSILVQQMVFSNSGFEFFFIASEWTQEAFNKFPKREGSLI
jgi:hypothetical protein